MERTARKTETTDNKNLSHVAWKLHYIQGGKYYGSTAQHAGNQH